ncbi:hypothetical protein [Bacillus sp. FJAT-26390]|uniref:hypothetical protein n=1 Tax=Bacillus sp. FJAT-26390 TaxID=1743142 RepID=UPI000808097D|nr:hypothetical protein [Bacillus sp. FJAT-26390]OBZ09135.1 hypothetical protein A7975_23765 [Bacillus sp. FJAT-26390]
MLKEGIIGPYDKESKMRPVIRDAEEQTAHEQAEMLNKMKRYICEHRAAKSSELREVFSIRKEKVLEYMQQLVEEGFLYAPTSTKGGYTLVWDEEQTSQFLMNGNQD